MDATQSIYDKATGTSTTDTVTEPTDAEAERRAAQSTSGSGLGAAAQHLASVKSGLSDRRTLVVKLVIVTQKEEIVTQATLDTGSEVDIVSPDFARQLWHAGARYGDRGGCIKVIGGGVVQPEGSMRVDLCERECGPEATAAAAVRVRAVDYTVPNTTINRVQDARRHWVARHRSRH